MAALTPEAASPSGAWSFSALERQLDRAESLAERIPRLPRTCLYRCLARYAVLRSHGFPAEFVMALSPRGPDEDGHAWLEFDGVPYREERAAEFVVSFRYPAPLERDRLVLGSAPNGFRGPYSKRQVPTDRAR